MKWNLERTEASSFDQEKAGGGGIYKKETLISSLTVQPTQNNSIIYFSREHKHA